MSDADISTAREWYDRDYQEHGRKAQRLYPNEELLRFMGRHYFSTPRAARGHIEILEVGCGTCSNLWMIAREGFRAHGLDLSGASLELGRETLRHWNVAADLTVGSMTELPFAARRFDAVVDVFSSYCLTLADFSRYLVETRRVLKRGGRLFVYTPSTESDAFRYYAPACKIDARTLNGIYREDSPFTGNHYPFRFSALTELRDQLTDLGFVLDGAESITRTYRDGSESFQHLAIDARAP